MAEEKAINDIREKGYLKKDHKGVIVSKAIKMQFLKAVVWMSLLTGGCLNALPASAAQELKLNGKEKLRAEVSSSKINRITFGSGHFSRIVGDSSKYNVIIDELGANLFLTSRMPIGSEFEISIINAAGLVADLVLKVKDMEGQIINIHDEPIYNVGNNKQGGEIANMLKSMIADERGKYYVKTVKRAVKTNLPIDGSVDIIQDRTYRYGNLTGARLVVKDLRDKKEQAIKLKEEYFKDIFESVKAISISNKILIKNKPSYVWMITKTEGIR